MNIIGQIKSIKLPNIKDIERAKKEEKTFIEEPQESQEEHKNEEALKILQEKAKAELSKLTIENDNLKNLSQHRITYSWWIFGFVVLFVLIVLGIIVSNGLSWIVLNDNVLNILLATNTVQVVGVLYIIAKWLYPNKI